MRALLLALALAGDARSHLGALEARRNAEELAAKTLADQERSVLDTLGDAERALAEAQADLRRVEADRAQAELALQGAQQAEAAAQARHAAALERLRPRLAARYRMGRAGELQVLVSSPSLAELVRRRYLFDRVLARDAALVSQARSALVDRERARAAVEAEAKRVTALAAEAQERRSQAQARREERQTLLGALRTARAFHERAAAEVAAQSRKLAEFVATLPPGGAARSAAFAGRRGRLPMPADGPVTVGFGRVVNPKFNTVTFQNGVDIAASAGAPVHAVAPGRVVHSGWFKGYGNLVIVDHGDGYHTLVAHLGSMRTAMGEEVDAGSILGTVGDSGSLKGPYLYFEIREKGRPVDPRPWLGR
ncbi:MAG TPA: peptidoglycan DD-metalloendopeptidase family protein [Anaeromyxobacteraceae bacterium]|nr:peptidoglycan DD-metalloendopeptidase family protein [Anaeromyxobacteraceae bacterium]